MSASTCQSTVARQDHGGCTSALAAYQSLGACSAAQGIPGGNGADGGAGGDTGSSSSTGGALQILMFTRNVAQITDALNSDTVTFIAVVTDTAGLDTLAGGSLTDDTSATYGAFGTGGAQNGTYQVSLTWSQINQVRTIDFNPPGATRTFTATFFDNAGHRASASVSLMLTCGALSEACTGKCTDFTEQGTCGACMSTPCSNEMGCASDGSGQCITGSFSTCASKGTATSCAEFCKNMGKRCSTACGVAGEEHYDCQPGTDQTTVYACTSPFGVDTYSSVQCCCG